MSSDNIRPWARWMINHRMRWLLVGLAACAFPLYFLHYLPEAFEDFLRDIRSMK